MNDAAESLLPFHFFSEANRYMILLHTKMDRIPTSNGNIKNSRRRGPTGPSSLAPAPRGKCTLL